MADLGGGNLDRRGDLQYGGRLNADTTYRVYGDRFSADDDKTTTGTTAADAWHKTQGGFRLDWDRTENLVTVQGDTYTGREEQQAGIDTQSISGANLLSRWTHAFEGGSSLQVQAYYDNERRFVPSGGGGDQLNTYDLDIQHSFALNSWNAIVWGGGERSDQYEAYSEPGLVFSPNVGTLNYANLFVEDTISITNTVKVIAGIKLEDDAYVGVEPLPSLRASWKITNTNLLWAAISRAVRSPTPFDRDAQGGGPPPLLIGGADFQSEKLTAYELGYRTQPTSSLSLSVSTYYNDYRSLRSIDFTPTFFPVEFTNFTEGDSYGIEVWGNYRVNTWWRLSAGFNVQHENLTYNVPLTPGILAPYEAPVVPALVNQTIGYTGDDPTHQIRLHSSMDFAHDVTLDLDLRNVGALPNPVVPNYTELNARIGWHVTQALLLSLTGSNLIHNHHVEFVSTSLAPVNIGRSFFLDAQYRF